MKFIAISDDLAPSLLYPELELMTHNITKGTDMNILIAEDEFATADAIQRLVEHMGHATRWACSGPEALVSLEKTPCELMILSAQLRDADITYLLPSLRRHHPDLPVVALTSRNSLSLEQQIRKWGVIYYLIKPLNTEELGSIVSHVSIKQA